MLDDLASPRGDARISLKTLPTTPLDDVRSDPQAVQRLSKTFRGTLHTASLHNRVRVQQRCSSVPPIPTPISTNPTSSSRIEPPRRRSLARRHARALAAALADCATARAPHDPRAAGQPRPRARVPELIAPAPPLIAPAPQLMTQVCISRNLAPKLSPRACKLHRKTHTSPRHRSARNVTAARNATASTRASQAISADCSRYDLA